MVGSSEPDNVSYDMSKGYLLQKKEDKNPITWQGLRRRGGENWPRHRRPNLFYPLFIDEVTHKFVCLGESPSLETDRHSIIAPDGTFPVWPLAPNGDEGTWQISQERFMKQLEQGTLIINSVDKEKEFASVLYLKNGDISRIESGQLRVLGRNDKGQIIVEPVTEELNTLKPGTIWNMPYHDASTYGTLLMRKILPGNSFAYPKSLYAVRDTLDLFTRKKKNALIVDFFAGSGTTLHAVNLLNAEDGGKRRCIMVTNNEVSEAEAKTLRKKGYQPSDEEAEHIGEGAREDRKDQGVSDSDQEYIVVKEQCIEVGEAYPLGRLDHIEVSKAHRQRHNNRDDREYDEKDHEGGKQSVAALVDLHHMPCISPFALFVYRCSRSC